MSNLQQFQNFGKRNKDKIISNNRAVIYTRVSDIKQQDNTSLESQKKYCTEYAQKQNFEICGYYGGTYASAKTDDREAFQKMLTDVKRKKISNIIVYSIDRFSRAGASAIATVEKLNRKGINVLSVTQPVDTQSSTGTFFQNINLLFSKYDNDQRREKTITGMRQRLLNGFWMGNAPIGYKNARNENNVPVLILDPVLSKFVKKAFLWKVNEGLSNTEIIEKLKLLGMTLRPQQLSKMLNNPIYCGLITHSLLDGEVVEGKHPAIISKQVFLKIHGIESKRPKGYKQNLANEELPLKGFTKCESCGKPLTGYLVKSKGLYYYKCKTKGCKCNRSAKKMHEMFEDMLEPYGIPEVLIEPLKVQLKYTFEHFNKSDKDLLPNLKYKLKEIEGKIEKLQERFVFEQINQDLYDKFYGKLRKEKDDLASEIHNIKTESSNLDFYLNESLDLFSNINKIWRSCNYRAKQKLQETLFPTGISYSRSKDRVRTFRVNSVLELTSCISREFEAKKTGTNVDFNILSPSVTRQGFEPRQTVPKTVVLPLHHRAN